MSSAAERRVFWFGPGSPVGKVPKGAIRLLRRLGWREVPQDTSITPVFCFTTRKGGGGDFPPSGKELPEVRQLPQSISSLLDDKRALWDTLAAGDATWCTPQTITDLQDSAMETACATAAVPSGPGLPLLENADGGKGGGGCQLEHPVDGDRGKDGVKQSAEKDNGGGERWWYLKHRWGVKGRAVEPILGWQAVSDRLDRIPPSSRNFYVLQQGVTPALYHGRRAALRAHVLTTAQDRAVYLHEDVIVLEHAVPYDPSSQTKAVHVSQAGKNHPAPYLLSSDYEAQSRLWPQIGTIARAAVQAMWHAAGQVEWGEQDNPFHLFGFDVVEDICGNAVLLEVNSYPAMGDGTMSAVDHTIYVRLFVDMLRIVMPEALHANAGMADPAASAPAGFHRV